MVEETLHTDPETDNTQQQDTPATDEMAAETSADQKPGDDATAKEKEWNDKYLRLYSEFENFRRRTQKEKEELRQQANKDLMLALLPVLDNLERAMKSMETAEDVKPVLEGVQLIHSSLFKTLENKGLKPVDAKGQAFDADLHEAITQMPAPEEDLKGKVLDEVEKGYTLHEKIIRYSKVIIGA